MWKWRDEFKVPKELLNLLDEPSLPDELRQQIELSRDEVESYGAVSHPTIEKVEFCIHTFADFIENLSRDNDSFQAFADRKNHMYK